MEYQFLSPQLALCGGLKYYLQYYEIQRDLPIDDVPLK